MATWNVEEVTLEAHYIGHAPDKLTLPCKSVSEIPGKYFDDTAADGAVQTSEIEQPSLLAKGIDLNILDAITWEPNRINFRDLRTGEVKEFRIQRRHIREPNTAKFAMHS
jgi:hypothetical protein